jgi:hypothetical protein
LFGTTKHGNDLCAMLVEVFPDILPYPVPISSGTDDRHSHGRVITTDCSASKIQVSNPVSVLADFQPYALHPGQSTALFLLT